MKFLEVFKKKSTTTISEEKITKRIVTNTQSTNTDKYCSCGVKISASRTMCASCKWSEDKSSDGREIFHMMTKDGQSRSFSYLGHTRFAPNEASTCGYGSDDWFYLCEDGNIQYLLLFSDNASYGTAWMCTELLDGDYENLLKENVNFWCDIAYSKERTKFYGIHLTDIESVRHLLPTSSRCGKLTDESFMR